MGKVLVGLAVVLVTVIGGFLIYSALNKAENNAPTPEVSPTATATHTPETSPSANIPQEWEVYTSQEMNFSIAHPLEMTVDQPQGIDGVRFLLTGPSQTQGTEMYDGISLTINVDTYDSNSFQAFVEQERAETVNEPTNPEVGAIEQVTLGGIPGYQFTVSSLGDFTHIYLPLDNNEYAHIYYLMEDPENQGFQEMLNLMLASLEFQR